MARYKKRQDGEGFNIPEGKIYRLGCCDCGLVHDIVLVRGRTEDGEGDQIGFSARRNNRATAAKRAHRRRKDYRAFVAEEGKLPQLGGGDGG